LIDAERCKLLHGPYRPTRCRIGQPVCCEVRGWCVVKVMSAGRIHCPVVALRGRGDRSLAVCGDLARAVRRESNPLTQEAAECRAADYL
jgi:hypothetical protein